MNKARIVISLAMALLAIATTVQAGNFVLSGSEHLSVTTNYDTGYLWGYSTVTISQNGYVCVTYVNDKATLNIIGCTQESSMAIYSYNYSSVNINSGNINSIIILDNSVIDISGGYVDSLQAGNNSAVYISGGNIAHLNAYYGYSLINISGGNIENIQANGGIITITGYDFHATAGLNIVDDQLIGTGILTGKWLNQTNSWSIWVGSNSSTATIQLVSDPVEPICGDINHPYPPMDFNRDCVVDFYDFALFMAHWLDCTSPDCNQ